MHLKGRQILVHFHKSGKVDSNPKETRNSANRTASENTVLLHGTKSSIMKVISFFYPQSNTITWDYVYSYAQWELQTTKQKEKIPAHKQKPLIYHIGRKQTFSKGGGGKGGGGTEQKIHTKKRKYSKTRTAPFVVAQKTHL